MRELPPPGPADECPRCGRTDVGLYVIFGSGDDHRHLCGACAATAFRAEVPQHDTRGHDPRADPANCAEAALWEAAGGTGKEAALEHGLAALHELGRRIDGAVEDAARALVELATARTGSYADMGTEGAAMVAAYDDPIEELEQELVPETLKQLRSRQDALDALGRQLRQLRDQLAQRRWPRVVRGGLPDGPHFIHLGDDERNALLADLQDAYGEAQDRIRQLEAALRTARSAAALDGGRTADPADPSDAP